ncbi:response regulator [Thalassospira sp. MA62]|nr:response regulator [Thalassospira sp. MA62]
MPLTASNTTNRTVMVVDDSDSNRALARRILQTAGYQIVEACNGQAVINMLRGGINADLILMDVEMPEIDGLHATRQIRHMPGPVSQTPIIALSAHQSRDWNMVARQSGVDDFFDKPLKRESLLERVKDLICASSFPKDPLPSDDIIDTPSAP